MKRNKLILTVLALVLSSVMFMACGAPANLGKTKYAGIVGTVGETVIASDGSKMNLYKEEKAVGDSAYSIEAIYFDNIFTGFYKAKRAAGSGLELMNADGKFLLTAAPSEKITSITPVASTEKDANGFKTVTVASFIAVTTRAADPYAVLKTDGQLSTDFYMQMTNHTSVIKAVKMNGGAVTDYALKPDGTVIASSKYGISILTLDSAIPGDVIVEVIEMVKINEVDTARYTVYSKTGTKHGTYNYSGSPAGNGYAYTATVTTGGVSESVSYYIDASGVKTLTGMMGSYVYSVDNAVYIREGTVSTDFRIKNLTTGAYITAALDYADTSSTYTAVIRKKGETKYDVILKNGTVLFSGLTSPTVNYAVATKDSYTVVCTDNATEKTININENGTKTSRALVANESYDGYYDGAIRLYNSSEYKYSLMVPAANVKTELYNYSITNSNGIISFRVKGNTEHPYYHYATLSGNLKTWNGSYKYNNLYLLAGAPESALEESYINISSSLLGTEQIPLAKGGTYTKVEEIKKAAEANAVVCRSVSVAYMDDNGNYKSANMLMYTDSKGKAAVLGLGENYSVSLSAPAQYFYKTHTGGARTIHEFYNDNGTIKIRDIAADFLNPSILLAASGKPYITTSVSGRNELYDMEGKLLLPANYAITAVCGDLVTVSSGSARGVVKLEKNGKFKLIKQLEYSSVSLLEDGTMLLRKNTGDLYYELCDANGKTVEQKVIGISASAVNATAERVAAAKAIIEGGTKELTTRYTITLPDGKQRLMTVTISEDNMENSVFDRLHASL